MSESQQHSELDLPPGFKHLKPDSTPALSNGRRTATAGVGGSSSSSSAAFSQQKAKQQPTSHDKDGSCVDHQSSAVPSNNPSGMSKRNPRRRAKPKLLDPSPPHPLVKKRGRGRPPGSGRKQRFASWLAQQEQVATKDSQVSLTRLNKQTDVHVLPSVCCKGCNQSSSLIHNQYGKQGIHLKSPPLNCQHKEQPASLKRESQDVTLSVKATAIRACDGRAQDVHETAFAPRLAEAHSTANSPQYGREKEGTQNPNYQHNQNIDTFMHQVANAFDSTVAGHPAADGSTGEAGVYTVNPNLTPILQAIINKHGDIAKDCPLKSGYMRTSVLEGICKVVRELQRIELTELDSSRLYGYYSAVKDAQTMKLDVKWLHQRLDEIHNAIKSIMETKKLTDIRTNRLEQIEYMKKELQKLKSEIEVKEGLLALETLETDKLSSTIRGMTSRFQRFQSKSLMDGLL